MKGRRGDFLKLTYIKMENEDVFIEKKKHYAHMSHIVKVHAFDVIMLYNILIFLCLI